MRLDTESPELGRNEHPESHSNGTSFYCRRWGSMKLSCGEFTRWFLNEEPAKATVETSTKGSSTGISPDTTFAHALLELALAPIGEPCAVPSDWRLCLSRKRGSGEKRHPRDTRLWDRRSSSVGPRFLLLIECGDCVALSPRAKGFAEPIETELHRAASVLFDSMPRARDGIATVVSAADLLCVIAARDERAVGNCSIVLFAHRNLETDGTESFCVKQQVCEWDGGLALPYLQAIYHRNLMPLVTPQQGWHLAFSSPKERELAKAFCGACIERPVDPQLIERRMLELLEELARSFGVRLAEPESCLEVHSVPLELGGMGVGDQRELDRSRTGFVTRTVVRDTHRRMPGLSLLVLRCAAETSRVRAALRLNGRYPSAILIHPDGVEARVEMLSGRSRTTVRIGKSGVTRHSTRFVDWLVGHALVCAVDIQKPAELALDLASRARMLRVALRQQLEQETSIGRLRRLFPTSEHSSPDSASDDGLADAIAQTVGYGLFAARWMHATLPNAASGHFSRTAALELLVIGGRWLVNTIQLVWSIAPRGRSLVQWLLDDMIDWLARVPMRRIFRDRHSDGATDPILRFYEPFLQAYDPKMRTQRGVFFTPRPVVSYMVRSAHELLRTEFGLSDGLADIATWHDVMKRHPEFLVPRLAGETDAAFRSLTEEPFVRILDPATGTGNFLVEVIEVVWRFLTAKWRSLGLNEGERLCAWREYVPKHLLPRLFGFELMTAPCVIARLRIGLKLIETGYRPSERDQIKIHLTNALEPSRALKTPSSDDSQSRDAIAIEGLKQWARFTVVVGNPPYAGHSRNNEIRWIVDLVKEYSRDEPNLQGPGQAKWLQDDYVKFLRLGQYFAARTPAAILAMVTNHRYLTNRTFRGMRRQWSELFPFARVLDLHGNRSAKEVSPIEPDENVFDIEQGVAIGLFVRGGASSTSFERRDVWGPRAAAGSGGKYSFLESHSVLTTNWEAFQPTPPDWLYSPAIDADESLRAEFQSGLSLLELMPGVLGPNGKPQSGLATMQDGFALSFSVKELEEKVERFLRTADREEARQVFGTLCNPQQWDYEEAKRVLASGEWRRKITRIGYSPLDFRYTVYDPAVAVHLRRRLSAHLFNRDNLCLVIGESGREVSGEQWDAVACVKGLLQLNYFRRNGSPTLPLYVYDVEASHDGATGRRVNLSQPRLRQIADGLGLATTKTGQVLGLTPEDVFYYAYASLHSPGYRGRYATLLQNAFPRLMLPRQRSLFFALVELGERLVALHCLELPTSTGEFVRCPVGSGVRVEKVTWMDDCVWLDQDRTYGFGGITRELWDFHVGGYRVCQKWLKDRRRRQLTSEDTLAYRRVVSAVSETIAIMRRIDRAIEDHGGWPNAFVVRMN